MGLKGTPEVKYKVVSQVRLSRVQEPSQETIDRALQILEEREHAQAV